MIPAWIKEMLRFCTTTRRRSKVGVDGWRSEWTWIPDGRVRALSVVVR